jgi:uncharacterized DUF497 family protein
MLQVPNNLVIDGGKKDVVVVVVVATVGRDAVRVLSARSFNNVTNRMRSGMTTKVVIYYSSKII